MPSIVIRARSPTGELGGVNISQHVRSLDANRAVLIFGPRGAETEERPARVNPSLMRRPEAFSRHSVSTATKGALLAIQSINRFARLPPPWRRLSDNIREETATIRQTRSSCGKKSARIGVEPSVLHAPHIAA